MSQAVDLYLFHLVFDVHLPVIAMLVMFAALSLANSRAAFEYVKDFKYLLVLLVLWSGYLLINGLWGANFRTSFVLLVRFVGSWLIAFQLGVYLYRGGARAWTSVSLALLISFLLITLIWFLQSIDAYFFQWLQPWVRNPTAIRDWGGLYVNPNVLGFALVSQAAVTIWYTLHTRLSPVVIPVVWLITLFGVVRSRSTNAFIGLIMVGVFALFAYYQLRREMPCQYRRRLKIVLPVLGCTAILALGLLGGARLSRVLDRSYDHRKTTWGWSVVGQGLPDGEQGTIARIYEDDRRQHVIELSGPGLTHHFIYEISGVGAQQDQIGAIEWSMSSSGPFVVTVLLKTDRGPDELLYTPPSMFVATVYQAGLAFELGPEATDGKWHKVSRDLQADLQKGTPGAQLLEVSALMVTGRGKIDDIKVGQSFHETFESSGRSLLHAIVHALYQIDTGRMQIWRRSFGYWLEKPFTGIGFGSFQYMPAEKTFFHGHSLLLNLLVEQGLIGVCFLLIFCAALVYQMRDWVAVSLLACFFFSQLFEDESLQFCLPVYLSFMLGYSFQRVLCRNHALSRDDQAAKQSGSNGP